MQSLALCLNLLYLKHATKVRHSLNSNIRIIPPPNDTLSNLKNFSTSSFIATLITTNMCWPLGLGLPSHLIIYTSTPFSIPNRSIANLLTFLLLISITKATLTQSALTVYHLGPISLTLGIYSSSH